MNTPSSGIPAAPIGAILAALLMAGCAGIERSPPAAAPAVAAPPVATVAIEPSAPPSAPAPELPQATRTPSQAVAVAPAAPPTAPLPLAGAARQAAAKPAAPPPKAPPRLASAQPPATQLAKPEPPAPARAKPQAPPPLDLKSLETRLKETKAIGVFTKLTLKNQVDELLDRFRAYYQGRLQASLAELRRSYDLLVLKVLALLQDTDPPLAVAIASSRESIWGVLSNPAKFAAV